MDSVLGSGVIQALAALAGYLAGSIPFGLILSRLAGYGDIRAIGSGNIGATNVLRTGNKALALATLVLDGGKGAVPVVVFARWGVEPALVAAVAAVVGHNFPLWLRFRGGKGVATTFGTTLALAWPVGLGVIGIWLAMAGIFRYSSLAALAALMALPVLMLVLVDTPHALAGVVLAVLGVVRHRDNIRRLRRGEEARIGERNRGGSPLHG